MGSRLVGGELFDFVANALALINEREARAVRVERARDSSRNRPTICHARDKGGLPV